MVGARDVDKSIMICVVVPVISVVGGAPGR